MIDHEYMERLLECNRGSSLISLWLWSKNYPGFHGDLKKAKEGFFFLVESFMRRGILRLAHDGEFLAGSIEGQLKILRDAWPSEYDEKVEEKDINNLWWYIFAPAGAVWIYPDGYEVWT